MNPETTAKPHSNTLILNAEDWLKADFEVAESEVLIGTPQNPIIRPLTKNIIQAPEKAFKTTFLLRLALGLSAGNSVFPSLPVNRACKVLYLHGELAPAELKERLQEAVVGLPRPLERFFQGRSLTASLVTEEGRKVIWELVQAYKPEILVIDPWQSFIAGADENSFKEMSGATAFLDRLIAEFGVTLLLAVHQGKNAERGARGHSVLAGWRDTRFTLKRDKESLNVEVEPRWAKPPDDLKLKFHGGTLWEGDVPSFTNQAQRIRDLLTANGGKLSRQELGFGLGLEDSAFRNALMRARETGAIEVNGESITLPSSPPASLNHPLIEGGEFCDGAGKLEG